MYSTITSGTVRGICSYLIQVEVDTSQGLPVFDMVGYLSGEVREARERVRVALKNADYVVPPMRITVNLSPADLKKEGTGFDLPIAVALLKSLGYVSEESTQQILFLGELGLNGEIRPVNGVLPIVREAKRQHIMKCIVPKANAAEGAVIEGIEVYGMEHIREVIIFLQNQVDGPLPFPCSVSDLEKEHQGGLDFAEIQGQEVLKRAAMIAAAGFHHLLMVGPPGSGKTMVAKRIPTILPKMQQEECLEVSTIYSVSGLLSEKQALITTRPFISPHHTITMQALAGGGSVPRPGAVSLAHRGVLFLDEMAEFHRQTLDILRQPLEDKVVQIARSTGTFSYPADFLLVGALNPCPCGYYPDMQKCHCTENEIHRYLNRISGPILDRMDLVVEAPRITVKELNGVRPTAGSGELRQQIALARQMQEQRFEGMGISFNADMGPTQIKQFCKLGDREQHLLERMFMAMNLSARAYHKILKVARTIADLEGSQNIMEQHLTEAACYRSVDQKYWGRGKA